MEIAAASFPGIYLMGMCSRQERIQKDIDVVIQKSRAEKDCLFAGEFASRILGLGASQPPLLTPPLPRFPTAKPVDGGVGLQVPVPGALGNSCSGVSWRPKGDGGTSTAPPPKLCQARVASGFGGSRTRAVGVEG